MYIRKILVIVFLLYSAKAFSCSCVPQPENQRKGVEDALGYSSSVVLALATSVTRVPPEDKHYDPKKDITEFSEIESWKGVHGKKFYTKIVTVCCMCGFRFEQGETYLLYLGGPDAEGFYTTSTCSRTKKLASAKADVQILRKLRPDQSIKLDRELK